jgi:hypothetical protein
VPGGGSSGGRSHHPGLVPGARQDRADTATARASSKPSALPPGGSLANVPLPPMAPYPPPRAPPGVVRPDHHPQPYTHVIPPHVRMVIGVL